MKLKDFLKYIPDNCEVGILTLSRTIYISYGLMDVAHVYAGVCVESYNTEYLSNSAYPIDLFPKLIIELE